MRQAAELSGHFGRQETASMLPALALAVRPCHRVLDMCAAPGSKTTQLLEEIADASAAEGLTAPTGLLVANDSKPSRLQRLLSRARRVPSAPLLATCADGTRYPELSSTEGEPVRFDRVLCDVPCSSDGTLRKSPDIAARWSPHGGMVNHRTQLAILERGLWSCWTSGASCPTPRAA